MKRLIILLITVLFFPLFMQAQTVEISPFGGYVFPARISVSGGYVRFNGNAQYGGMVSVGVNRVIDVDILYNRIDTKAELNVINYPYQQAPLSINYMHIGFTKNFRISTMFSPFIGLNAGACLMAPKSSDYTAEWFFSMGLNGGAKIYFSKRFGIRLQAQALVPIQGAGFCFVIGTGGSGGGVSLNSTMVQFGFTGGLIFRLGYVPDANATRITY